MISYSKLKTGFRTLFGEKGGEIRLFYAPGRLNLIGEHTDHYGGHVFPCAIDLGIAAAVRIRKDKKVRLASLNECDGEIVVPAPENSIEENRVRVEAISIEENMEYREEDGWVSYPKGVLAIFKKRGIELPAGFDILYMADLPADAGLASSSALEVLTALVISSLFDIPMNGVELAQIAKQTENEFIGVPTCILDPAASALGRIGCGILITADTMRREYVPLSFGTAEMVVISSGVSYKTVEAFEERKADCERALKKLQSVANIKNLCDLPWDKFESCKDVIMNETATMRARHVIYEDARTIRAVSALRVGNIRRFGDLLNQSHNSLRNEYGVSCPEIDFLADQARTYPGVFGSRMTGGGFGGSTISIVSQDKVDGFCEYIENAYREAFGRTAAFYVVHAADGALELDEMWELP